MNRGIASLPGFIGPYRVIERLRCNAIADVYLCEQQQPVARRVEVKVLREGGDEERFRAELQWLALMEHSGFPRVLDTGMQSGGPPWFATEHVAGRTLAAYCHDARARVQARIELLVDICSAVQHAHQKGMMPLSPDANGIVVADVDGEPQVRIVDFGTATADRNADACSDVHALGVLLHRLLAGSEPMGSRAASTAALTAGNAHARTLDVASSRTLARRLRGDLDAILARALNPDTGARYLSAAALADDLRRYLDHLPVAAAPLTRVGKLARLCRRHRLGATTVAGMSLALLLFVSWSGWQAWHLARQRDEANREALKAQASTEFLVDLFALGNPVTGYGADLSVQEALDIGLEGVLNNAAIAPEVRAETLLNVARVYAGIGLPDRARQVLQQVLADHPGGAVRRNTEALLRGLEPSTPPRTPDRRGPGSTAVHRQAQTPPGVSPTR